MGTTKAYNFDSRKGGEIVRPKPITRKSKAKQIDINPSKHFEPVVNTNAIKKNAAGK